MALIVQKYGGTSVADPERIRAVAEHVAFTKRRGNDVVVVVSAMGKSTDNLIKLANDVSRTQPGRELDMLLTTGERISMAVVSMALADLGIEAMSFTGSQVGIITDTVHTKAKILEVKGDRVRDALAQGKVCVVAGFQGISTDNEITTLGRGGSDTTAVAIAAALGADSCEIYTDVDGIFSADPRICPKARQVFDGVEVRLNSACWIADVQGVSAGMISVNNSTSGAEAHLPFGGNGKSGNGSRQSGVWVLDQFTRWQSLNWDWSGKLQKAQMDLIETPHDPGFTL